MREAHEELGVVADSVTILGKIDDVPTPVGFVITPVVGWLADPPEFTINEREVREYFEVDVDELADPANFKSRGEREIAGVTYPVPEFHVAGRLIWGATARITQRLLELARARGREDAR
jgi:8-oxo-dGTP pyrophosphatase MutT (NUDIX family)